ncbi:MAG: DUF1189 family protein [Alphaproteobacteria bacterium]
MKKLINYLKQGKGRGLRAMLIFTALIGFLLWGMIYTYVRKVPENADLNAFVNQLPTIVIQNGEVVEPAGLNKPYAFKGQSIFYLQTDRDEVSPFSADGIYLTRKIFAFVAGGQIQQATSLSGDAVVTPENLMKAIRSFVAWTPVILGGFYFTILWVFYLLVVSLSALIALICRLRLNKGAVWRSASFATIAVLLIDIIMGMLGYSVVSARYPMLIQLLTTILLVLLIAFGIREKKKTKEIMKDSE